MSGPRWRRPDYRERWLSGRARCGGAGAWLLLPAQPHPPLSVRTSRRRMADVRRPACARQGPSRGVRLLPWFARASQPGGQEARGGRLLHLRGARRQRLRRRDARRVSGPGIPPGRGGAGDDPSARSHPAGCFTGTGGAGVDNRHGRSAGQGRGAAADPAGAPGGSASPAELCRAARISLRSFDSRSLPLRWMWPLRTRPGARVIPISAVARVLLPLPDSPTRVSRSPWRRLKLTPSTALTTPPRVS